MSKPKLVPMYARTLEKICSLPRDNLDAGDYWILLDGSNVVLTEQGNGKPVKAQVKIPARHFARLARWYVTGKVGKP